MDLVAFVIVFFYHLLISTTKANLESDTLSDTIKNTYCKYSIFYFLPFRMRVARSGFCCIHKQICQRLALEMRQKLPIDKKYKIITRMILETGDKK